MPRGALLGLGVVLFAVLAQCRHCGNEDLPCIDVTPKEVRPSATSISLTFPSDGGEWCDGEFDDNGVFDCKTWQEKTYETDLHIDNINIIKATEASPELTASLEKQLRIGRQPLLGSLRDLLDVPGKQFSIKGLTRQLRIYDDPPRNAENEITESPSIYPCEYFSGEPFLKTSRRCVKRCGRVGTPAGRQACGIEWSAGHDDVSEPGKYYVLMCKKISPGLFGLVTWQSYTYQCGALDAFTVVYRGSSMVAATDEIANVYKAAAADVSEETGYTGIIGGIGGIISAVRIPGLMSQAEVVDSECVLPQPDVCMAMFSLVGDGWANNVNPATGVCRRIVNAMADRVEINRQGFLTAFRSTVETVNRAKCIERCVEQSEAIHQSLNSKCQTDQDGRFVMPGPLEQELHCFGDNFEKILGTELIQNALGEEGMRVWSKQVHVGWDEARESAVTFAFEKESGGMNILNLYRPKWISEEDWGRLCPDSTALCHDPFCGESKMCVPVGGDVLDNALVQLHQCIHWKGAAHWNDALACAETAIKTRFVGYSTQYTDALWGRVRMGLLDFWKRKGIEACVMDNERPEPDCDRNGKRVVCDQNQYCNNADSPVIQALSEAWPSSLPEGDECSKTTAYMSRDVHKCMDIVRTNLESAFSIEAPDETLDEWLLKEIEYVRGAYERFSIPKERKEKYNSASIFSDWVSMSHTPRYLSGKLVQEVAHPYWEVNSRKCEATLHSIYLKIATLQIMFGNNQNLHLHVVFPRPKSNCCHCEASQSFAQEQCSSERVMVGEEYFMCDVDCKELAGKEDEGTHVMGHAGYRLNEYIASLASHMNDYAAFGSYTHNQMHKYLAVFKTPLVKELRKAVAFGGEALAHIEDKTGGHSWGDYKKAFIALRAGIYGSPSLIGFEFRAGVNPSLGMWKMQDLFSATQTARMGGTDYEHALFIVNLVKTLTDLRLRAASMSKPALPTPAEDGGLPSDHAGADVVDVDVDVPSSPSSSDSSGYDSSTSANRFAQLAIKPSYHGVASSIMNPMNIFAPTEWTYSGVPPVMSEEEFNAEKHSEAALSTVDGTEIKLSVQHLLSTTRPTSTRRKKVTLKDIDEFQLAQRKVDWNYMLISASKEKDLLQKWCELPDNVGGMTVVAKCVDRPSEPAVNSFLKLVEGKIPKNVLRGPKGVEWKLNSRLTKSEDGANLVTIRASPVKVHTSSMEDIQLSHTTLMENVARAVEREVASHDTVKAHQNMKSLLEDYGEDLMEVRKGKKNKGGGKGNKSGKGGNGGISGTGKNADRALQKVVISEVSIEGKEVPITRILNPEGCIHFGGGNHKVPVPLAYFSMRLIAQGRDLPATCRDDYDDKPEDRIHFQRVAAYVLDKNMPLNAALGNSVFKVAKDACEEAYEKKKGERGEDAVKDWIPCDEVPAPDLTVCLRDIWYRLSFILLNVPGWETFLSEEASARPTFRFDGIPHDLVGYSKDNLYSDFFMNPGVRECYTAKNESQLCAKKMKDLVHEMEKGDAELRNRFLEE